MAEPTSYCSSPNGLENQELGQGRPMVGRIAPDGCRRAESFLDSAAILAKSCRNWTAKCLSNEAVNLSGARIKYAGRPPEGEASSVLRSQYLKVQYAEAMRSAPRLTSYENPPNPRGFQ